MVCLFNFSCEGQQAQLDLMDGDFTDLVSGEETTGGTWRLAPYQYRFCRKRPAEETKA